MAPSRSTNSESSTPSSNAQKKCSRCRYHKPNEEFLASKSVDVKQTCSACRKACGTTMKKYRKNRRADHRLPPTDNSKMRCSTCFKIQPNVAFLLETCSSSGSAAQHFIQCSTCRAAKRALAKISREKRKKLLETASSELNLPKCKYALFMADNLLTICGFG